MYIYTVNLLPRREERETHFTVLALSWYHICYPYEGSSSIPVSIQQVHCFMIVTIVWVSHYCYPVVARIFWSCQTTSGKVKLSTCGVIVHYCILCTRLLVYSYICVITHSLLHAPHTGHEYQQDISKSQNSYNVRSRHTINVYLTATIGYGLICLSYKFGGYKFDLYSTTEL